MKAVIAGRRYAFPRRSQPGLATLAHAVHAGIRPAALLPVEANAHDSFVMALRRIEFENGRLLQAQILLLKARNSSHFATL